MALDATVVYTKSAGKKMPKGASSTLGEGV